MPQPQFPGYEIEAEVGRGTTNVVYRARDTRLGRLVALKVPLLLSPSAALGKRLLREARVMAAIEHPNTVRLHAVEYEGAPFLVMEWIDGGTLADRLDGGPWPVEDAIGLIERVARGVHALHERMIVHRDINPTSILLTLDGQPKLGGFTWVKWIDPADPPPAGRFTDLIIGTPGYMPPEQVPGLQDQVGRASDVYSLGAVLYELLTGRLPILKGQSAAQTLVHTMTRPVVPPRQLRLDLPAILEDICLICLQKEPTRRYPTAGAFADDLLRV
jgi:serine/threonine-protein kinase